MRRPFLPSLLSAIVLAACAPVGMPESPSPQPPSIRQREAGRPARRDPPQPGVRVLQPRGVRQAPLPLPDEVHALWVVRTTLVHPDSIRAMVDRAATAGFNTLIVQVRGRGDAYYRSRWEPRPEAVLHQGTDFDPLALVIREAHGRGLGVHAWVNAHLLGGTGSLPSDPLHLIRSRPDLLAVPRELATRLFSMDPWSPRYAEALLEFARAHTDRIEGIYSAPSHPEVKEHLFSIWMDLLESYDLDGLHFDYIRYPGQEFDYSRSALDRFREWVAPRVTPARREELELEYRRNPVAFTDALPGPWDEFRRAQITDLVERIYFGVKKRYPDVVVSAAVFANAEDAYQSRFQDWRGWVRRGILDAVAPMAYTADNARFQEQIRVAVEAAGADRVWAGIGIYQNTYRGTLDKIDLARRLGTRGVVLFSYDWAVSEGESDQGRSFLDRVGVEAFRRR